ncbi:MAG: hypothetical protein ACT4QD_13215 [Acidobacteriota bacterium]
MEFGVQSPLLDAFRRGDVAREVRLDAARGRIAPAALEQLALLVCLTTDADPEVRLAAEETLASIPAERLGAAIASPEASADLREFFASRGIVPMEGTLDPADPILDLGEGDLGTEPADKTERVSLVARLATMSVPERLNAALKGSREIRAILIRDPNKLVALSVLSSPKLNETEVESFARMGSVAEDVLRTIARRRSWMKSYAIVLALVRNAKTPVAVSLPLLARLQEGDVKRVSLDHNVPEPLRLAARRKLVR